jgi:hypothetical protein
VEVRLRCDAWSGWEADAAGETDAVCVRAAGLPLVAVTDPLLSPADAGRRAGPLLPDSLEAAAAAPAHADSAVRREDALARRAGPKAGEDGGPAGIGSVCDAAIVTAASCGGGGTAASRSQSLAGRRPPSPLFLPRLPRCPAVLLRPLPC